MNQDLEKTINLNADSEPEYSQKELTAEEQFARIMEDVCASADEGQTVSEEGSASQTSETSAAEDLSAEEAEDTSEDGTEISGEDVRPALSVSSLFFGKMEARCEAFEKEQEAPEYEETEDAAAECTSDEDADAEFTAADISSANLADEDIPATGTVTEASCGSASCAAEVSGEIEADESGSAEDCRDAAVQGASDPYGAGAAVSMAAAVDSNGHVVANRAQRNASGHRRRKKSGDGCDYTAPASASQSPEKSADKTAVRTKEGRSGKNRVSKGLKFGTKGKIAVAATVLFLILFLFVIGTKTDEKTGKKVTLAKYVVGELADTTFMGNAEERLSRDMEPIYVDEDSPLYLKYQTVDRVNVLLLGVNQNMTDTIMVGSYDMTNQQVDIISIPRDTYYYRAGYGKYTAFQKINSMWRTDGIVSVATAVSDLLCGMPIHYYVIVDYEDIKAVMKEIGGVEVNIPFYMKYDDTTPGLELHIDIPAGNQIIDDTNVMEFLRFRHTNPWFAEQGYKSYAAGDIQRIQVQQDFVKKVIKKCLTFKNLPDVASILLKEVDSDLTIGTAVKVATKAAGGLSGENLNSYTLPGKDFTNELSFWQADKDQTFIMVEKLYGIDVEGEDPETLSIIPGSRIRFVEIPSLSEADE